MNNPRIDEIGNIFWYKDTLHHNENGPATILKNGTKFWFINGLRHRIDGPAIEWNDGDKDWYQGDQLHRRDGPAVIRLYGKNEWWIDGKQYSKEEWQNITKYPVLDFESYHEVAQSCALFDFPLQKEDPSVSLIAFLTLGLVEESGEVAGKLKKWVRDGNPNKREEMITELGDVLWYMDQLAVALGSSLNEVAEKNKNKILDRQSRNKLHGEGDNR